MNRSSRTLVLTQLLCVLAAILLARPVLGASPELRLPPAEGWTEVPDPAPPPGAHSRFFSWSRDPSWRLRVTTQPGLRLDYSASLMLALGASTAKQNREAGRDAQVTESIAFDVGGVGVGRMRTVDGPIKAVAFWLPGDDGDVVVALMKTDGEWDGARESEVSNAVMAARGLRRAETSDESFATVVPVLLGSLLAAVGVGALLMRFLRRPRRG